jgi:hypothetical protein
MKTEDMHCPIVSLHSTFDCVCCLVIVFIAVEAMHLIVCTDTGRRMRKRSSPAIKPVSYRDQDCHIRLQLAALHWNFMANKARALYFVRNPNGNPHKTRKNGFSKQYSFRLESNHETNAQVKPFKRRRSHGDAIDEKYYRNFPY